MLKCENAHDSRDFDGSYISVPCGDNATFAVGLTYEDVNLVPPQMVSVVLYVCESCKNLITAPSARSSADHPDHVDVVYVHELGESGNPDKEPQRYTWDSPLNPNMSHIEYVSTVVGKTVTEEEARAFLAIWPRGTKPDNEV